jgi:hypothetical protein
LYRIKDATVTKNLDKNNKSIGIFLSGKFSTLTTEAHHPLSGTRPKSFGNLYLDFTAATAIPLPGLQSSSILAFI